MQKTTVSPRVRYFKTVSNSEFHTVDSGSQAMDSGFLVIVEIGFQIPFNSGIANSSAEFWILYPRVLDFASKYFPDFRMPCSTFIGKLNQLHKYC